MIHCMKIRKRYVALVKRSRHAQELATAAAAGGPAVPAASQFTPSDENELRKIEEAAPIQALLVYRQLAAKEVIAETKRAAQDRQKHHSDKDGKGKSRWMDGWLGGGASTAEASGGGSSGGGGGASAGATGTISSWFRSTVHKSKGRGKVGWEEKESKEDKDGRKTASKYADEEDEEDERLIKIIQSKIEVDSSSVGGVGTADLFIFRLYISSSATLRLTAFTQPVAVADLALTCTTEMHSSGLVLTFALDDFHVIDECTVNPLTKYLIASRGGGGGTSGLQQKSSSSSSSSSNSSGGTAKSTRLKPDPKMLLTFEAKGANSLLRLTAKPIELTWNKLCVERTLGIFILPAASADSSSGSSGTQLMANMYHNFAAEAALPIAGDLEIVIEIDAPKIIIPDDCCVDKGCILFDSGTLKFHGTFGETCMEMDISLMAVNVGMPRTVKERYSNALYLINPFDINVGIQTIDKSQADMSIIVQVMPGLQAEFDAVKITRLLALINIVVFTINEAVDPTNEHEQQDQQGVGAGTGGGAGGGGGRSSIHDLPLVADDARAAFNDRSIVNAAAAGRAAAFVDQISATHRFVDVLVTLPLISMNLHISDKHTVTLLVNSMETKVIVRQHDLQLLFGLKSLKLLDSLRHPSQYEIIFTPPLSLTQLRRLQKRQQLQLQIKEDASGGAQASTPGLGGGSPQKNSTPASPQGPPSPSKPNTRGSVVAAASTSGANTLAGVGGGGGGGGGGAGGDVSLISITLNMMYTKQSPLYTKHGMDIKVDFAKLGFSLDEDALMRLKPFFEELYKGMVVVYATPAPAPASAPTHAAGQGEEVGGWGGGNGDGHELDGEWSIPRSKRPSGASHATAKRPRRPSVKPTPPAPTGPVGMLLTFCIGSVSLSLMRAPKPTSPSPSPFPSSPKSSSKPPSKPSSPKVGKTQPPTPSPVWIDASSPLQLLDPTLLPPPTPPTHPTHGEISPLLETAYSAEVVDLLAAIDVVDLTLVDVKLRSFRVLDCRSASAHYVPQYRELLCRSTFASQYNSQNNSAAGT